MIEIVNRMDYKVDVNVVVGTYHANMLKQYGERQTLASHCLMSAEANAKVDEDQRTNGHVNAHLILFQNYFSNLMPQASCL